MSAQAQPMLRRIGELLTVPMMYITFIVMALGGRLGLSRFILQFMARQMQAQRIKERAFQGYQPTKHDLFVCTYAKSGTYWTIQIAFQIAHRGRGEYEHIHDVVPWPEAPMPQIVKLGDEAPYRNAPTGLRVIKTHLTSAYVPYSPEAKYIVVVRDPKEVLVSSYFFTHGMLSGAKMVPVAEWHKIFLSGNSLYGSWSEHLASYWPWRSRANVLFLTFGEMKADLEDTVRRIAAFMGVTLSESEIALVVAQSQFQHMQRIDHKFTPQRPFPFSRARQLVVMRKGERGQSAELLTREQQAEIDRQMQAELRRRQCDFPYAEVFETINDRESAAIV